MYITDEDNSLAKKKKKKKVEQLLPNWVTFLSWLVIDSGLFIPHLLLFPSDNDWIKTLQIEGFKVSYPFIQTERLKVKRHMVGFTFFFYLN